MILDAAFSAFETVNSLMAIQRGYVEKLALRPLTAEEAAALRATNLRLAVEVGRLRGILNLLGGSKPEIAPADDAAEVRAKALADAAEHLRHYATAISAMEPLIGAALLVHADLIEHLDVPVDVIAE